MRSSWIVTAAALVLAGPLAGQVRVANQPTVPSGDWPPAGMCRIWVDGVTPSRQPPVTDCATAQRQVDGGLHVLYGGDSRRPRGYYDVGRRRVSGSGSPVSPSPAPTGGWGTYHPDSRDTTRASGAGWGRDAGSDVCYDRNHDGRCDDYNANAGAPTAAGGTASDGYPTEPPLMMAALRFRDGIRDEVVRRWVGDAAARVTVVDANRDGRYENALFLGADGKAIQAWSDTDGDGRAEQIKIYQNGGLARTLQR